MIVSLPEENRHAWRISFCSLIAPRPRGFLGAQDWVRTGTNLGVQKIRIAAADFKAGTADLQTSGMKSAFDQTLI